MSSGDARLHLRVVAAERGQDVHEQQRGAAGPDPDGQAPGAPVRRPAGRADDLVGCGEGPPGGGHHRLGGRGDPQSRRCGADARLLGDRLPDRLRDTLVAALGLFTLALGTQQALASFGADLTGAVGRSAPLLVLGALLAGGLAGEAAGLGGRLERLGEAVKRLVGGQARFVEGLVLASLVACVGPLAVLGAFADGLLVIAIGLRLLGLARIRAANLLPAVLLAPLATGVVAAIRA